MSERRRICEWCSNAYTVERTGRGRPPPYCSETCKREAQNELARRRMRAMRKRDRPKKGEC